MKKSAKFTIACLILLVAIFTIYLFKFGGDEVIKIAGGLCPIILSFFATLILSFTVQRFKTWDSARLTWFLLLLGTATFCTGECIYFFLEVIQGVNPDELYPSVADIFWCSAYIFFLAGMLNMITGYFKSGLPLEKWKQNLIPSGIVFIAIVGIMYKFLLQPIALDEETGSLEKFLYFFYPISDLLMILPAFFLIYITRLFGKGMLSKPWRVLALGFLIMAVADMSYSYLDWQDLYKTGNFIDMLWDVSYWLIGLSGFYQIEIMESI